MQGIHKIGSIVTSVILLSSLTWNALNGQVYPTCFTVGRAVPVFPPKTGTVPIYKILDSLELHKLEIDIQKAEDQVSQTNFLHRLIPQIGISASYGIGNLLFIDPSSTTTYIMPKDAYRLSLNFSLSELFFSSKHSDATLQLSRLQTEYQHMKYLQEATQIALRLELLDIGDKLQSVEKQLSMIQDLIHFNELRFEQGKIEYDALIRTKLEMLSLQSNINTIKHQQAQLLLKINQSDTSFTMHAKSIEVR
jgi:outer membrane protein TolC